MSYSRRQLEAFGEPFGESCTQAKAGGGRIYGGGSSGGGGGGTPANTTSNQVVDLPDWAKPYGKESLGKASALTDTTQNPYQTYGGSRQAEFDPLQTKAFTDAENMGASSAMLPAALMAGEAGLGALSAGANFNPYQTGQFTGDTAQNYMNPYMQNVVDIQKREAQRTADIAGTGRNAQAVKSGAFGGSRQAIMDAEANRNLATQMGDIQAKGSNAAFQQAMQQFNTEQALGEQSKQYGAGLGMQGFQTALTGAGQLANIGQQTFGQEMDVNKLQQQYGTQQQAFNQQGIDTQYQDFLNQQRYPYQQLEFMNSMLRGTPMGTVQSMYQPPPSQLSQLAGIGTAAYGVSQMKEGGEVPGYAVGGGITGLLQDDELQQRMQSPTISQLAKMAAQDEMHARAQMRAGAAAQQAPQGEQPTVADEYMMSRGVAALPTGEINMAGGGILAFAEGGDDGKKRYMPLWERAEKQRLEKGSIYSPEFGTPIDDRQAALEARQAREAEERAARMAAQEGNRPYSMRAGLTNLSEEDLPAMDAATTQAMVSETNETDRLRNRSRAAAKESRAGEDNSPRVEDKQDGKKTDTTRSMAERVTPTRVTPKPVQSFEDILARLKGDPNTRQAIIDQVDLANVAKEDVYKQGIANLKRDQDELGEFGTERETRLKKQEEGLAGLEKRNQSMAFIEAGLAMMSGNSANAFENIGKGALVGTKSYKAGMEKLDAKRDKLDEAFMNLYDIRRGEKVANKKEIRAAEMAVENAKVDSAQAMANITGKKTDNAVADFRKGVDAYTAAQEKQLDRESNEYRTQLTTDATLNAAILSAAKSQGLTEKDLIGMRQKAQTLVQQRIKDTPGLAQRIQKDPSIREKLMRDALAEVGVPGASGGQDDAGGVTMNFDAQGNPI